MTLFRSRNAKVFQIEKFPGCDDPKYMARRKEIRAITDSFYEEKMDKIPEVYYLEAENATWKYIVDKMDVLRKQRVCKEYWEGRELLGFTSDKIPQLEEVNERMKALGGFEVLPAEGWLDDRTFFQALADKKFYCTQYIRYADEPEYTPEPDILHEVTGHLPVLIKPSAFTEFVQLMGEAGSVANEEELKLLQALYWFTAEFGLILQDGEYKVYGASPAAALGEIQNYTKDEVEKRPFKLEEVLSTSYPIDTFQPLFFYIESFEQLLADCKPWLKSIIER